MPVPDEEFYRWYGHWASVRPSAAAEMLEGVGVHWWVVGGWAVDAFTAIAREHEDIDVGFFRADLAMTAHDGDTWISPRDARVRLPFDQATYGAEDGIRYLRPELVLFMKARVARPKDDVDLERILPLLEPAASQRLRTWLELVHPGHRWLARLRA